MATVRLKPGRERPLYQRHPWVFSGAIAGISGDPTIGETVEVQSDKGEFLAWAAYSPKSQITLRIWGFAKDLKVGEDLFRDRIRKALSIRGSMHQGESGACRLIYAESDGLPGFIADKYANYLVVQFLSAGAERWRDELVHTLMDITGIRNVYERSDVEVRHLEGLELRTGLLYGENPPEYVLIKEYGLDYRVDIKSGHKTGFYLDQRENRLSVRRYAKSKDVLDCFAYTGGFALNALAGGAEELTAIEASEEAIQLGKSNQQINKHSLPQKPITWICGNVFEELRKFRDTGRKFDMIIMDPPKFAATSAQVQKAARGYKDVNLLAFKLLREGGVLVTFSCSGGVEESMFQKIVAGAALDAGVDASIVERLDQNGDHPVSLSFPESRYLKGLVIKVREKP